LRGTLGPPENRKAAKILSKPEEESLKTGKPPNNDQNLKFLIFKPSTLDTKNIGRELGPFNAPVILLAAQAWCALS